VVVGASYLFFRLFEAPFIGSPAPRAALKPAPSQIVVP
jgi:hypothetical protein